MNSGGHIQFSPGLQRIAVTCPPLNPELGEGQWFDMLTMKVLATTTQLVIWAKVCYDVRAERGMPDEERRPPAVATRGPQPARQTEDSVAERSET
jgi:hypothetical protein